VEIRRDSLKVSCADAAERQIDARPAWARFFVDSVFPIVLGLAFHQEQAAGRKFQSNRLQGLVALVLQDEDALFTQT
jgi:hypothetical protein